MIRTTMWIYPWDIIDMGAETVLRELIDDSHVGGLSIATSYHAGRFLQPRSPRRKVYFPEDGTIYFEPDMSLYRDSTMKPQVSSTVSRASGGRDVLRELSALRAKRGFTLNGWTVCLHNTRLGMLHPDACTQNAFGDRNFYNLCPSSPLSISYLSALVKDLTEHYILDSLELESPNFMGFAHEFHHEKDGVGLTTYGDFLLSLCFCPECMKKAAAAGADPVRARDSVRRRLDAVFERDVPAQELGFVEKGVDGFADDPELRRYLAWRFAPVTELCRLLRASAAPRTRIYFLSLVTGRAWLQGIDVQSVSRECDGMVVCAYDSGPDQVYRDIREAASRAAPGTYLAAGFRVFHPETQGAGELKQKVRQAVAAGAQGLNFYNYGLIPRSRLAWIRESIDAAGAAAAPAGGGAR
jgi:hypothetical protein